MGERQIERLSLHLLGTPEVRQAGRVLGFPTRKALALLIYLATEDGAQSRERIAALLWPESDEERSRGALRSTLGLLRAVLRDAAERAETLLVGERDRLEFAPGTAWESDLQLLRAAFDLARAPAAPHTGAQVAQLQAALDRYRGDFLTGFSISDAPEFDDWAASQRELWHGRAELVCARLSQALLDGGDLIAAREVIARWLALAPLNEEAHRRLISLAILSGDRAAGLRAYAACRVLLRAELQAEPSPETTALAERLRTLPAPTARRPGTEGREPPATAPVPLVGRLAEHATLVEAYRAVARNGSILVTIEGEPGIGKTRLVGDFLRWATAQGADVLHGRAYETGRLSYQPLIEALRARLARDSEPERVLAPLWLAELQRLLPELAERHPALPVPEAADEATARGRLFEAVARFGQVLAGRATVIVFLDDLHWADTASLDLLAFACRRWAAAQTPLLVVATLRSDELRADPALTSWLASQGRDLALRRLALGPLAPPDTARLARALVETRAATTDADPISETALAAFADWLQAETGGHPLYAIETVKLALERGDAPWRQPDGRTDQAEPPGLAPSMQAVIRARLARLDAPASQLLVAGAVLGTDCDFPTLCQVAEIDEGRGLPALDLLLTRQLLREAGTQYRFSHDKIREVAYAEASAARRGLLHRRAVAVLERAGVPAATLARHALAAGLRERAFGWSIAAGDDALRVFAVRDALAHYERAWALVPVLPQATPADRDHLAAQLGRACELTDQYARARTIYAGMLATARERRDLAGEAAALHRLATVASHELDFDAQATYLHQALDLAEREGDTVALADISWNLGRLHFFRAEFAPGRAYAEQAVQLARDLGLREETARGLNFLALSEVTQGRWAETLAHGAEARAIYRELGNRALEADCLAAMAAAHLRLGQTAEGIATARAAYNLGREIDNRWGQADAAKELALGLVEQGEYAEALAVALDAVTVARDANYPPLLILTLMILGAIHRRLGAFETARSLHREVLVLDEPRTILAFSEQLLAELCADAAALGDWAGAHTWARRALDLRDDANLYAGLTHWYETEALLRAGEEIEAASDLQRFARRIGANRRYRLPYLRAAATLAHWRGAPGESIGQLREAAALAEALALPGEAWEIAAALGQALRDGGDEAGARQEFARASRIVRVLAEKLPDAGLRASFLARARGRGVSGA